MKFHKIPLVIKTICVCFLQVSTIEQLILLTEFARGPDLEDAFSGLEPGHHKILFCISKNKK